MSCLTDLLFVLWYFWEVNQIHSCWQIHKFTHKSATLLFSAISSVSVCYLPDSQPPPFFFLHLTLSVLLNSFHMIYIWKLIYSVLDREYKEAPILCIIQILFIKSAIYTNNQKKDNFPILRAAQLSPQLYNPVSVFNFPSTHCLWSSQSFPSFASLSDVNLSTYPQPCVKYGIHFALSNGLCLAWLSLCFFSHIFLFTQTWHIYQVSINKPSVSNDGQGKFWII